METNLKFVVAPQQPSMVGVKRAALYLRVSTDEQRESGYGLTIQLDECCRYMQRLGYRPVGEHFYRVEAGKLRETTADDPNGIPAYVDDYTGFSPVEDRPTGKRLMAMLRAKQADAVIAHRVDRIARDSLEARIAARTWLRSGVEMHIAKNGRITNDNDIAFLIDSWKGQEDYSQIVANLHEGINRKARGGRVVGCHRAPYGYRFTKDEKGKTSGFEIFGPEAKVIRLIFGWYIQGDDEGQRLSLYAISNRLTAMRVPTPAQMRGIDKIRTCGDRVLYHRQGIWNASGISNIINNEVYAGIWRYGRRAGPNGKLGRRPDSEQIKVSVPAIIDHETWEKAHAQRKRNSELSKRNSKRQYLLSGYLKCGCGRAMAGCTFSGKRRYRCSSIHYHKREQVCSEKSIRANELEAEVWGAIDRKLTHLDELWAELKAAQAVETQAQDPRRAELQAVESFIAQGEEEAKEIAVALRRAKGKVVAILDKQQDDLNTRLEGYEKRRRELVAELAHRQITDESIESTMQYARLIQSGFASATYDDKRRMMENLKIIATVQRGRLTSVKGAVEICTLNNAMDVGAVSKSHRRAV